MSGTQSPTIEMAKGAEAPFAHTLLYSTPVGLAPPVHFPHDPVVSVPDDDSLADASMIDPVVDRNDDRRWGTVGLNDDRRWGTVASEATGHRGDGA